MCLLAATEGASGAPVERVLSCLPALVSRILMFGVSKWKYLANYTIIDTKQNLRQRALIARDDAGLQAPGSLCWVDRERESERYFLIGRIPVGLLWCFIFKRRLVYL